MSKVGGKHVRIEGRQDAGKGDVHIHSAAGDAVPTPREILDYVEEHTDLDLLAITDHDEVRGALEAREIAARGNYRVGVVVGTEVTTRSGHLLGLFVEERLPMLQPLERSIAAIHRQGGLCIAPHPLSWLTLSVGERRMRRYGRHSSPAFRLDGLEAFNPTVAGRVCHQRVLDLNKSLLGLAEIGGSDAHQLHQIGTAYTVFPGRTAEDLRRALLNRETSACGSFWTASDHMRGAWAQSLRALFLHPSQKLCRALGLSSDARGSESRGTR